MFCAFENPALILRLYGRGEPILPQDPRWPDFARHFNALPGARQIFRIDLDSIQTSCGWGVPHMAFARERETLSKYHAQQDQVARLEKISTRTRSIDGLPVTPPSRVAEF
jgi:hypothetical protein